MLILHKRDTLGNTKAKIRLQQLLSKDNVKIYLYLQNNFINKKSIISTKKSWDIDHNTIIEFLTTCFKNIFSICRKFGLRNLN